MNRFTERLRRDAKPIWNKILEHPFVEELYTGSLPIEKFRFYVKQDYNYLIGSIRAFSLLASKSDYRVAKIALELAYADATVEMDNYLKLLDKLNMSLDEVLNEDPAPTNVAYTNFLIATCSIGSSLECLVSLLPCFWSYQVIAEYHKDKLNKNPNNLYVEWAKVYLSEEYRKIVNKLRGVIDDLWKGDDYNRYRKIFINASRYEYLFWEMAYKLERWPV